MTHRGHDALEARDRERRLGAYDPWRGELRLLDPSPNAVDEEVAAFLAAAAALPAAERDGLRATITDREAYTLLAFARRSAVFGLRASAPGPALDGLRAAALVDADRVDARDVLVALALLHHALDQIGTPPATAFEEAAGAAGDATATLLVRYPDRAPRDRDLRDAWGYIESVAAGDLGLLEWGFEPYAPTLDLEDAIVGIVRVLDADAYVSADPAIATELPDVWLRGPDSARAGVILVTAPAVASVSARLRPVAGPTHAQQQLTVFLAETATDHDASHLAAAAATADADHARLPVASGRLCAIVIARSFVVGVPHHESDLSLARLTAPIRDSLGRHAG